MILVFRQEYPNSDDFQQLVESFCDELPSEMVLVQPQYSHPYSPSEQAEENHVLCDTLGLLCFICTEHQVLQPNIFDHVPELEKIYLFSIVFTYRVHYGIGEPDKKQLGVMVPYQVEPGHWVSHSNVTDSC